MTGRLQVAREVATEVAADVTVWLRDGHRAAVDRHAPLLVWLAWTVARGLWLAAGATVGAVTGAYRAAGAARGKTPVKTATPATRPTVRSVTSARVTPGTGAPVTRPATATPARGGKPTVTHTDIDPETLFARPGGYRAQPGPLSPPQNDLQRPRPVTPRRTTVTAPTAGVPDTDAAATYEGTLSALDAQLAAAAVWTGGHVDFADAVTATAGDALGAQIGAAADALEAYQAALAAARGVLVQQHGAIAEAVADAGGRMADASFYEARRV